MTVREAEEFVDEKLSQRGAEDPRKNRKEKIILHDLRAFCNSIDNAVLILRKTGVKVEQKRRTDGDDFVIEICVKK